jgi:PAS domain S-box-containing protein
MKVLFGARNFEIQEPGLNLLLKTENPQFFAISSLLQTCLLLVAAVWQGLRNVLRPAWDGRKGKMKKDIRVLMLEDSDHDAELIKSLLESEGFNVAAVRTDTESAFRAALTEGGYDLILSDFTLPGYSGKRALALARARCPEVPCLFVSGTIGEEQAIESLKSGATDYVLKQNLKRLGSAVRRALQEAEDRREKEDAEQALRVSEERFRLFMRNSPVVAFIKDEAGRFVYCNDTLERLYGSGAGSLIGKTAHDLLPAPMAAACEAAEKEVFKNGRTLEVEEVATTPDGAEHHWLVSKFLIPAAGGQKLLGGLAVEITERKQAEETVRRLNAGLERRVLERTADLEDANRELDAFTRSVSHDLRAPLVTVATYAQMTMEDHGAGMSPEIRAAFSCISTETQNMSRLIDDMLRLSKVSRWELTRKPVDLGAEAERVVKDLRRQQPERQVGVIIAPGLIVQADEGLLRIALENLLGNAWKFTSKRPDARIEVGAIEREGRTHYFVRDNGAGFSMEHAHRLFGAFQRLHSDAEFPGTGVGLATVHRVIKKHGGTISAESEVNRGTIFYFTL